MEIPSSASKIQANLQELFKAKLSPGDAYIRFQLTSDITALLSMEQVQESLVVEAEKITPVPSMPESIIGIINSRDRVFCAIDLAQLLKLNSPLIAPRQYQIIVLQTTDEPSIYIGLAVISIQGIVRLTTEQIKTSLSSCSSNIASYLCGIFQPAETIIPILDFECILETLSAMHNN